MAPEYAHAWLPKATCDESCMRANLIDEPGRFTRTFRTTSRIAMAITLLTLAPLLGIPLPGRVRWQRGYCRLMLRCLGVRISVSGGPIRDIRGSLVVAGHVSWVDVFAIGAVLPGSFVARADLIDWPGLGVIARMMRVIPIERETCAPCPGWWAPLPHGCVPARRWWPSRRAPPGVVVRMGHSAPRCFRPRSMRNGRCSRCG